MFNHLIKAGINHSKMLMNTAKGSPHRSANNVRKQVSVDSRTKIYIETALINYANSGNCDIMYIPRCVGTVIICGIKACSRYNVLSAAVPGPKAPKAGRSPAGDRQTEGAQPGVLQSTPAKCRTSAVPLFTQKGKVVTLKGG